MNYDRMFVRHASTMLPPWLFKQLHQKARAAAGGVAKAEAKRAAKDDDDEAETVAPTPDAAPAATPVAKAASPSLADAMAQLGVSDEWALIEAAMSAVPVQVRPVADTPWLPEVVRKRAGGAGGMTIVDSNKQRQVLFCVALEPGSYDTEQEAVDEDEIEKAAHRFIDTARVIGSNHVRKINAKPVESYIAPQDLTFDGINGRQVVKKGSWVLGIKVEDKAEWQKVLDGGYTGISVGGRGKRRIVEEDA